MPATAQVIDDTTELVARDQRSGVGHARLAELAEQLLAELPAGHVPAGHGRRYELRHADPDVEAWLIAWPSGTGLAVHDHGDAEALVHVVRGRLRERFAPDGGDDLVTRRLGAGDRIALGARHVHEVANDTAELAVSLHLYSPRLTELGFRTDPGANPELQDVA